MKSPDNDIDRALQKALKRKFDDFEALVPKSSDDAIFSALNADRSWRTGVSIFLVAAFFTILLSVSILYYFNSEEKENAGAVLITEDISTHLKELQKSAAGPNLVTHKNERKQLGSKKEIVTVLKNNNFGKAEKLYNKTEKSTSPINSITAAPKPVENRNPYEYSKFNISIFDKSKEKEITSSGKKVLKELSNSLDFKKHTSDQFLDRKTILTEDALVLIDKKPFLHYTFEPDLGIKFSADSLKEYVQSSGKIEHIDYIFHASVLNTIQVLTVKSSPGIVYQHVNVPSEISLHRLGYKVTGGLAKKGFQLLASYSQLNQSFNYEVASDEFELIASNNNNLGFVSKGIKYEQNNKLKFIGLGIKKHAVVSKVSAFQNYFADLGVEFSRELNTGTNILWSNISIGKQVVINKNSLLFIGPYAEYSFMKIVNPDTKFQIQPYQIGLSVGLSYGKK